METGKYLCTANWKLRLWPNYENVFMQVGIRAEKYRYAKSLVMSSTYIQTYRMPALFFRSLPSSICLKWYPRITHLRMVWAFMSMIVRRDLRVLSLLVRERFIVTTLP